MNVLSGRRTRAMYQARDEFLSVAKKYPNSKYSEEALFYSTCIVTEMREYSPDFFQKAQKIFAVFLKKYPFSMWCDQVKINQSRFYALKMRQPAKAESILRELVGGSSSSSVKESARIMLEFLGVESEQ
jgi:outer membrane protein assembly factor BamD (BamD/ComL family)